MPEKKESEGQSHKRERGSGTGDGARGPYLGREEGLFLGIFAGVPEFLVTSVLMEPICLLSNGRFDEPFRP